MMLNELRNRHSDLSDVLVAGRPWFDLPSFQRHRIMARDACLISFIALPRSLHTCGSFSSIGAIDEHNVVQSVGTQAKTYGVAGLLELWQIVRMGTDVAESRGLSWLDEKFGPCVDAGGNGVNPHERHHRPISLQRLDAETAGALKTYLGMADELLITSTIHRKYPILWIMGRDGHVWFAIEEVIEADTGRFLYTLPAEMQLKDGQIKLGHPSLLMSVKDKSARIGGEIKFSASSATWLLSNRSGRYGMRSHQTKDHLQAVVDLFAEFDINLKRSFWPEDAA